MLDFLKKPYIAHRGVHDENIPENSLIAFQRAVDLGYNIELDVHIIKDNNIVVFHDDNLERMTGINRNLKDCTYEELQSYSLKNTNQKIPLLSDVLKLVNGKVALIVELKIDQSTGKLEQKLLEMLKKYNGNYAIESFRPTTVKWFRKHAPNIIRGQLSGDFSTSKMPTIQKWFLKNMFTNWITNPHFIAYDINALPSKVIEKNRGKRLIIGWTVNTREDYEKAFPYCDNLIFNNIEKLELPDK